MNSSSFSDQNAGRSLGQSKRENQVAMDSQGEQGEVSTSQSMQGQPEHTERRMGPRGSAIGRKLPQSRKLRRQLRVFVGSQTV